MASIERFNIIEHGVIANQLASGHLIGCGELKIVEAIDEKARAHALRSGVAEKEKLLDRERAAKTKICGSAGRRQEGAGIECALIETSCDKRIAECYIAGGLRLTGRP